MRDTAAAVIVETMLPTTCRVVVDDSARPPRRRQEERPDRSMVNVSMPKPTPSLQTEGVGRGCSSRRRPRESDPHVSSLDELVGVGPLPSAETVEVTPTVETVEVLPVATGTLGDGSSTASETVATDEGGEEERPDPSMVNVSIPKPTPSLQTGEVGRGRSRRRRPDSPIVNVSMPKLTPIAPD